MKIIQQIKQHPSYKEVLKDSFGGVMYNMANKGKYSPELLKLWDNASPTEKGSAGGIMTGAMNFLLEKEY